jgi:hypothetical protein
MLMMKTLVATLTLCVAAFADIAAVKAEPNLERRSQLALDEAESRVGTAKQTYEEGKLQEFRQAVTEIGDLAELSYSSLEETGKRARRNPKWFKRAEQKLLVLIRKVDSLEKDVSIEDRQFVSSVKNRVNEVHDNVLHDIMTKK